MRANRCQAPACVLCAIQHRMVVVCPTKQEYSLRSQSIGLQSCVKHQPCLLRMPLMLAAHGRPRAGEGGENKAENEKGEV